jgi:hypothetical protein
MLAASVRKQLSFRKAVPFEGFRACEDLERYGLPRPIFVPGHSRQDQGKGDRVLPGRAKRVERSEDREACDLAQAHDQVKSGQSGAQD